jgi:dihydrolipoamide dehydrogenase
VDVFEGKGEIVQSYPQPENTVVMNTGEIKEITSNNLMIATGSSPRNLPGLEVDGEFMINSNHALQLEKLPFIDCHHW